MIRTISIQAVSGWERVKAQTKAKLQYHWNGSEREMQALEIDASETEEGSEGLYRIGMKQPLKVKDQNLDVDK